MHASDSPASQEELAVHDKIFGMCNHDDWNDFRNQFDRRVLACTQCGEEVDYSWGPPGQETPKLSPADFLKTTIRKYSKEDVLASLTLRTIEAAGWTPLLKIEGNTFSCEFARSGKSFSSDKHTTRAAAVCQAAAKLGASGLFHAARSA